jgi:tRNA 2-thiouridine synthesizing protein E
MAPLLQTDNEGFLKNIGDWNRVTAIQLAASDGITLTEDHWEVVDLVRDYYKTYRLFPANRVLVSKVGELYGQEKGNSIYLMQLFNGKPAKNIAKIAGLPKPPNCD